MAEDTPLSSPSPANPISTTPQTSQPTVVDPSTPPNPSLTVVNPSDTQHPILAINMSSITKLTSSNYITWSLQVTLFLEGHDLIQFITPDAHIPAATLPIENTVTPNPKFLQWRRQDKLILMALLGAITTPLQPVISRSSTTLEAWATLASTYGRPSRGHLKQIKEQLQKSTKGSKSIDDYVQVMKTKADHLAILGKPLDHEDIIDYILAGLDDDCRVLIDQINGRDVPPTFEEIHEKLINREAVILSSQSDHVPAITTHNVNFRPKSHQRPPSRYPSFRPNLLLI